jgi:hypothetical protein
MATRASERKNLQPHDSTTHEMDWFQSDAFKINNARERRRRRAFTHREHTGGRCNSQITPPARYTVRKSTAMVAPTQSQRRDFSKRRHLTSN